MSESLATPKMVGVIPFEASCKLHENNARKQFWFPIALQERFVPGSVENVRESLKWLGMHFDEGPCIGGSHGSYMQVGACVF